MGRGARGAHRQTTRRVRELRLRRPTWRQLAAGVPALALVVTGTALAATGAGVDGATVAQGTTRFPHRIEVPAQPQREQATSLQSALTNPLPALALPTGMTALPALGSVQGAPAAPSPTVVLDRSGIPAAALAAYHLAASLLQQADPACHLDWSVPAAIGRVESNHARFGGNRLDAAGVARPGILGIPLDGRGGTARITDTDHGVWDHDTTYDRAVGPMQFIPGTWRSVGQDADGRGTADPQDMADAATAAGVYLCSGGGDLAKDADLYSAVYRYNRSDAYVRTVMNLARAYRAGVTELPLSQLPAAHPATAGSSADSGFAPGGTTSASGPTGSRTTPPAQAGGRPTSPSGGSAGSGTTPPTRTPSSTSTPPVVAAPAPPSVPAPVRSVTSAVSSVATQVVTTLRRVAVGNPLQLVGTLVSGVLPPTSSQLPAPVGALTSVLRTDSTTLPGLDRACLQQVGQVSVPLVGTLPTYQQVRCPANTR
ncbi:lytic transglycosylase domain-containing protein [Lapillicoccus jejuensis]|uniref:Membrane-bound lytic murein transglycosylase B n=1 Tax=Lapillicoccus jejuensis TaxID=402171 RepID=A0A542E0W6_9MICO|nr:lytic transglycosylase domain-containing protein [Lapillicoccus jejuensis]TQJ08965.1 membrane-bound lytic murein transglycosylase B [Lapillicoccus jejuensis]